MCKTIKLQLENIIESEVLENYQREKYWPMKSLKMVFTKPILYSKLFTKRRRHKNCTV